MSSFLKYLLCVVCIALFAEVHAQLPSLFNPPQRYNQLESDPILQPNIKPYDVINKNLFIKITASKTTCFVGEPVMIVYELYQGFRSQCKVSRMPSFTNSSVIEMSADEPGYIKQVGEKTYRVYLIRKVQLLPLQEGEITAGAASVDGNVNFIDPSDHFKVTTYSATVNSAPVSIHIKPLPEAGKPKNFTGAVGDFHISAVVDSNASPANENNNLHIKVEGSGNFAAIGLPEITWPKGTEHFDANDSQHINKYDFPVSGDASFDIPFIGTKTGSIIIPAISFSFFNPANNAYETVQTTSIAVKITKAISTAALLHDIQASDVNRFNYLWIVPAVALVVIAVWITSYKLNRKQVKQQPVVKQTMQQQPAATKEVLPKTDFENELQMLQTVSDNHEFFVHVQALLLNALRENLNITATSPAAIIESLRINNSASPVLSQAEFIMHSCNQSLYSPYISNDARETVLSQLQDILKKLNLIAVPV